MKPTSVNSDLEMVLGPAPVAEEGAERAASISTTDRLRLLWEHRRHLFRFSAWGLAVATLVAFVIPARYESSTRLMPPDDQSSSGLALMAQLSGRMGGGLGALAGDVLGLKTSGSLFLGILTSRTVQDDIINKFDLKRVYWVRTWESARRELAARTALSEDRKSGIIYISVVDHDPQRAAAIAKEYVNELNSVVSRLNTSSAHRERVFLEERLAQVKQDLESAEKEFSNFASKSGAIDIKEQGKAMVGGAATLQGELIAAESELQGLKQIYSPQNVRVRSLQAKVTELHNQLDRLAGKSDGGESLADPKESALYPSIRQLPVLGVGFADLYRRTKVQEVVFETLTQEYELAKVTEAKDTPNVQVLDPAIVPERKSFPPRVLIMFLGLFLSFAAGAIWVLGSAAWAEVPSDNPQKQLAQEVLNTLREQRARLFGFWNRVRRSR